MYERVTQVKLFDMNKAYLGRGKLLNINNNIIIIKGKNLPILNSGKIIFIKVYDEIDGIYPYLCRISVATDIQTTASIIRKYPVIERRTSLKIRTDLTYNIKSILRDGKELKDAADIKINILNLSVGGMLISSHFNFLINDIMTFCFSDISYEPISLEAKIIRIDKSDDDESDSIIITYGCRFSKMSNKDEAVILKYLFNRQLKIYKNK